MGRKLLWPDVTQSRFPEGTFKRIAAVLDEDEDRLYSQAVERELKRRAVVKGAKKGGKGR
jgi:hypothetical protein